VIVTRWGGGRDQEGKIGKVKSGSGRDNMKLVHLNSVEREGPGHNRGKIGAASAKKQKVDKESRSKENTRAERHGRKKTVPLVTQHCCTEVEQWLGRWQKHNYWEEKCDRAVFGGKKDVRSV